MAKSILPFGTGRGVACERIFGSLSPAQGCSGPDVEAVAPQAILISNPKQNARNCGMPILFLGQPGSPEYLEPRVARAGGRMHLPVVKLSRVA
jgi:hypothetical protein